MNVGIDTGSVLLVPNKMGLVEFLKSGSRRAYETVLSGPTTVARIF